MATGRTADLGHCASPSWSPDGRLLLFHRSEILRGQFVDSDVYAAEATSGRIDRLTNTTDVAEVDPIFVDSGAAVLCQDLRRPMTVRRSFARVDNRFVMRGEAFASTLYDVAPLFAEPNRTLAKGSSIAQLDIPYVHQTYDTPDWHDGRGSCAPTAAVMVFAYYNILPPWPTPSSSMGFHYNNWGYYICSKYFFRGCNYANFATTDYGGNPVWGGYGYMWIGSHSPESRMVYYYNLQGMTATETYDSSYAIARAEIDAGRPYTICCLLTTAGHLVVAHGLGAEEHTLILNDPYGNKNQGYPNYNGKNVRYDWPGYNNGYKNLNEVAWCIAASFTPPAICDTLVDDLRFGSGFTLNAASPASMTMYTDQMSGYGGHSWLMSTTKTDTCAAAWTTTLSGSGSYRIEAFVPPQATGVAHYRVTHANGTSQADVDQSTVQNTWVSLGTFLCDGAMSVRLGSGSTERKGLLGVDAVRWSYQGTTRMTEVGSAVPARMTLAQNYPNPFNSQTTISLTLSQPEDIRLSVFDLLGREVALLASGPMTAGAHRVVWDAAGLASGSYVCCLTAGSEASAVRLARVLVYVK